MPLQRLIDTFNEGLVTENNLKAPPLDFDGQRVYGHFGHLAFTSELKPVRRFAHPATIAGHDAASRVTAPANSEDTARLLYGEEIATIVSLDRLSRTVHMLNYLILNAEGCLFLQVHPHSLLAVKKNHSAYFENLFRRCGLALRRIVISLTTHSVTDAQLLPLLERLKGYRDFGYSTAVTFDEQAGRESVEGYCLQFLHRFAPDYVRFNTGFFHKAYRNPGGERQRSALFSAIRHVDIQVLLAGVHAESDANLAAALSPDYVQGRWYDAGMGLRDELIQAA